MSDIEQICKNETAFLNQLAARMGLLGRKNALIYWDPPSGWKGTPYAFGYTPWKQRNPETDKVGYFACKYRILKDGSLKLVKAVRFGRRKIAKARAEKWYEDYYGVDFDE